MAANRSAFRALIDDLRRQDELLTKARHETEKVLYDIEDDDALATESRELRDAISKYNKTLQKNSLRRDALESILHSTDDYTSISAQHEAKFRDLERAKEREERRRRDAVPDVPRATSTTDDDLILSQVEESLKCPFSQKLMVDPVKNSCGHSFSRGIVEQLLQQKGDGRVKCALCTKLIFRKDLTRNEHLARQIRRKERDR